MGYGTAEKGYDDDLLAVGIQFLLLLLCVESIHIVRTLKEPLIGRIVITIWYSGIMIFFKRTRQSEIAYTSACAYKNKDPHMRLCAVSACLRHCQEEER